MKKFAAFIFTSLLYAQSGTIVVNQTVTATAGTISCVFSNAATPTIHTVCTSSVATQTSDTTPAVGSTSGFVGSMVAGSNNITWIIQQPIAGNVTWQIAANGTSKSGNF